MNGKVEGGKKVYAHVVLANNENVQQKTAATSTTITQIKLHYTENIWSN